MEKQAVQTQVCRPADVSSEIRERLSSAPDHVCVSGEKIYLQIEQKVICLPNDPAGNELACVIMRRDTQPLSDPKNAQEIYTRMIRDPDYQPDPSFLKKYRIRQKGKRGIAVFQSVSTHEKDLCSIVSAMAPTEAGDAVVPIDYRTAVLIKDLEGQSGEEMFEFIEAVTGTMETEGIADIRAGIGREFNDLSEIRERYLEAYGALELGARLHRQDRVFIYEKQTLERIVDSIPEEKKKEIAEAFFGSPPVNGLSDEMLETVRVFFRNDLNLTAASKQLFIHRNTLNYRLDKIRKDYGLDLRCFQDAVVFRIISEIAPQTSFSAATGMKGVQP